MNSEFASSDEHVERVVVKDPGEASKVNPGSPTPATGAGGDPLGLGVADAEEGAFCAEVNSERRSGFGIDVMAPIRSILPSTFRPFVRRNYQHELLAAHTWPIAVSMVEGAVTSVIAKKAFSDTPDWVIATLVAAPAFCNVSSFIWTRFTEGRSVVRALNIIQLCVLAMLLVIALVPINQIGLFIFLAAALIARFCMVGVITLRSVIWRANYARFERARITGKLITVQTLVMASVSILLGQAMDWHEQSFRFIYPLATAFGLIGVRAYSRLRVRRPFLMVQSDRPSIDLTDYGQPIFLPRTRRLRQYGHYLSHALRSGVATASDARRTVGAMWGVLRDDLPYRGYMVCMTLTGVGNLAISAPLVLVVTERFHFDYLYSLFILQSIPLLVMPISIPFWSRFLDRVHVIRFRAVHVWVFVLAHALTFAGAFLGSIPLLACGQIIRGVGFGGGALAWNLGHNDFSSRQDAGLYMSVHVTLTGIRGAFASYLGVIMYSGVSWWIFDLPALEEFSFIFWGAVTALGAVGFAYLNWRLREITGRAPAEV